MSNQVTFTRVLFGMGADPEAFFQRDGKIIGAEEIIPEEGIGTDHPVVRDGVQMEFHPMPSRTLGAIGLGFSSAFRALRAQMAAYPGVSICWDGTVDVDRDYLNTLSEASRVLGCQPSKNFYGERPLICDPETYNVRSAGGHLHLDVSDVKSIVDPAFNVDERYRFPLLDIFVGNTCVLIDRDMRAAERRENYGRAGEHRYPEEKGKYQGIEYRTLSNFWLRDYALMDLVFGLSRIAIAVLHDTLSKKYDFERELVKMINIENIVKAIDTNNWYMAMKNFQGIFPFLDAYLPEYGTLFGLNRNNLARFVRFAHAVKDEGGLEKFFPGDPVEKWIKGDFITFEQFMEKAF